MTDHIYDKYDYDDKDLYIMEMIGAPLYTCLRDRLVSLNIPRDMLNPVIVEAVMTHDAVYDRLGTGGSEIVVKDEGMKVDVWVNEISEKPFES